MLATINFDCERCGVADGPIGAWRRKLAPFMRWPRRAAHISRSASVEFARNVRARTNCFVDKCQLGAFDSSATMSLLACPHPNPPPQAGEGAHRVRGKV